MDEQMKLFEMLERMIEKIGSKVDKTNETVSEIKEEQAAHKVHLENIQERLTKIENNNTSKPFDFRALLGSKLFQLFIGLILIGGLALLGIDISPIVAKLIPLF